MTTTRSRLRLSIALSSAALLSMVLAAVPPADATHGLFPVSTAIYRVPYDDGLIATVTFDHHDHGGVGGNRNRIDLVVGLDSNIVAAAGGWIRGIVDFHGDYPNAGDGLDRFGNPHVLPVSDTTERSCSDAQDINGNPIPNSTVPGLCQDYNNYVWIEHPNGEWSKYSHFGTGTVTGLGWNIGDWVDAGDILGTEADVGRAGGTHLHWEIGIPTNPNDPTPFTPNGGFLQGTNVVPQICDIGMPNLLAKNQMYTANPCTNQAPTADAGGPYVVDEGSTVQFDGTNSSDPDATPLFYSWAPPTNLDDPTLAQPTYSGIDDAVNVPYVLTVYDQVEMGFDTDATLVTVLNVPPTVTATGDAIDEAGTATVSAAFTDPGTMDTHIGVIDWGDGSALQVVTVGQLAAGVDHVYGDNGSYSVTAFVVDDDFGIGFDTVAVEVANVPPNLTLDVSGEIAFPGGDYQVVSAGEALPASAEGSDVGSDDLTFSWNTGDVNTYFNDGLAPDPPLSPFGTFPFFAADGSVALFADPGVETLAVTLTDDDGGVAAADSGVIVTGTADDTEGNGWWKHQYGGQGSPQLDDALLAGYLDIVNAVSSVFSEDTPATSFEEAHDVLSPSPADKRARARRQLMVAWLQFASGAVAHDAIVPLGGGDSIAFLDLMFDAEATILNPGATNAELIAVEQALAKVKHAS